MSWFQGGVFSGASLAVVPVADDHPWDALLLVVSGGGWDGVEFACGEVPDLVCLAIGGVDSTNQHVVGDVIQVSTVLQPWTSHGDVVSCCLPLGLDEDGDVQGVLSIPWLEGL